jgi:hypothetical protein
MRGTPGRRLQSGFALVSVAFVLAACASSPSTPRAVTATTHQGGGTTTTTGASSTSTTTAAGSGLSPLPTSGPLQAGAPITLPFTADRVTAAESPDGAVFAAPQDPTSPAPSIAWVVDGDSPAVIAEHVGTGIAALAADATNFYVATYSVLYAYNRSSGNQDGQWNMPHVNAANGSDENLVSLAASGGAVLMSVTQGNTVSVYRIVPSSSAGPRLVVRSLGAAIGNDGSVYYERGDHHLAALRPSGSMVVGPALADRPNGLGGGVQYVNVVAAGAVWVSEPAGQGLDATFTTYDAASLAAVGRYSGSVTSSVADTAAGPLVLEPGGAAACGQTATASSTSCVLRIDVHGATSDPVGVGAAVTLLGPAPAVIESDTSTGQFDLVRLS